MRPLRFHLNLTLDGCYDHTVGIPDEELHLNAMRFIAEADVLLFGRVTYQMMEQAWRMPVSGTWPEWMAPWMQPFAQAIDVAKKHVVSSTLKEVDWNAELVQGDLKAFVRALKQQPGNGIAVGGVKLVMALTELGLIDEYEFIILPRIAGRGPNLFAGLSRLVDLKLVGRKEFGSGAVGLRYEVKR
ncbi:MAG: dihydrofolate reductase family protein [Flavobacteriales bacterium]|nr:dihydrofolate reductase family protein [Flavobacteriales bacterium]